MSKPSDDADQEARDEDEMTALFSKMEDMVDDAHESAMDRAIERQKQRTKMEQERQMGNELGKPDLFDED